MGESPDCLLLSGTVVGENPDHVFWVQIIPIKDIFEKPYRKISEHNVRAIPPLATFCRFLGRSPFNAILNTIQNIKSRSAAVHCMLRP